MSYSHRFSSTALSAYVPKSTPLSCLRRTTNERRLPVETCQVPCHRPTPRQRLVRLRGTRPPHLAFGCPSERRWAVSHARQAQGGEMRRNRGHLCAPTLADFFAPFSCAVLSFLLITISEGCEPTNQLHYVDIDALPRGPDGVLDLASFDRRQPDAAAFPICKLVDTFDASFEYVASSDDDGSVMTFQTNLDAPRNRCVFDGGVHGVFTDVVGAGCACIGAWHCADRFAFFLRRKVRRIHLKKCLILWNSFSLVRTKITDLAPPSTWQEILPETTDLLQWAAAAKASVEISGENGVFWRQGTSGGASFFLSLRRTAFPPLFLRSAGRCSRHLLPQRRAQRAGAAQSGDGRAGQ